MSRVAGRSSRRARVRRRNARAMPEGRGQDGSSGRARIRGRQAARPVAAQLASRSPPRAVNRYARRIRRRHDLDHGRARAARSCRKRAGPRSTPQRARPRPGCDGARVHRRMLRTCWRSGEPAELIDAAHSLRPHIAWTAISLRDIYTHRPERVNRRAQLIWQSSFHDSMTAVSRSQPRTEMVAVPSANRPPSDGGRPSHRAARTRRRWPCAKIRTSPVGPLALGRRPGPRARDLVDGLAAGPRAAPDRPARVVVTDLRGQPTLEGAVVPFLEVRLRHGPIREAGQRRPYPTPATGDSS